MIPIGTINGIEVFVKPEDEGKTIATDDVHFSVSKRVLMDYLVGNFFASQFTTGRILWKMTIVDDEVVFLFKKKYF